MVEGRGAGGALGSSDWVLTGAFLRSCLVVLGSVSEKKSVSQIIQFSGLLKPRSAPGWVAFCAVVQSVSCLTNKSKPLKVNYEKMSANNTNN